MTRIHPIEKLAREICWAGFASRLARRGKTKDSYWKSLPESTRQNYRGDAEQFAYLLRRIPPDMLAQLQEIMTLLMNASPNVEAMRKIITRART